jgi:hypothetical protein
MLATVTVATVFAWHHLAWVSFVLYVLLFGCEDKWLDR